MKKLLFLTAGLLFSFVQMAQTLKPSATKVNDRFVRFSVYFESAKYELSQKESSRISGFLDSLNTDLVQSVTLRGFTDSDADSMYNIKLSGRRVATIKELLEESGIKEDLISRSYFGENMAGNDSISENLKSRNRRVEVLLVFKPIPKTLPVAKDTCKLGDTTVVLKNGTIVKGSICDLNDTSDLDIKEAITIQEMMEQGLQTMGNNENQLISGGMITISSKSGNCNFNKPITLYIPVLDSCSDAKRMSLFNTSNDQNGRVWSPVPNVKIRMVYLNGKSYYEIIATSCAKLNLDFLVKAPLLFTEILIISEVNGYTLKKVEMYNDCPRFIWSFKKKITSNSLKVKMLGMSKPPQVRFFLVNNIQKSDTLITPFMSLADLKHSKFFGMGQQYEDRTMRWLVFKKKEKVLYPWYRLQDKHVKKE